MTEQEENRANDQPAQLVDKQRADDLLAALGEQRNLAHDAAAYLRADLVAALRRCAQLEAQLKELTAPKPDAPAE